MKAFGVRLAAGAMTILLGAVMAAQAQKDHQDEVNSSWKPKQSLTAPTPIIGDMRMSDANEPTVEPNKFADVPNAVQLVQHIEDAPVVEENDGTFALPAAIDEAINADLGADQPGAMSLPSMSTDGNPLVSDIPKDSVPSAPQVSLNLPPATGSGPSPTEATTPEVNALMGSAPDAGEPANALRGDESTFAVLNDTEHANDFSQPATTPGETAQLGLQQLPGATLDTPENDSQQPFVDDPERMLRAVSLPEHANPNRLLEAPGPSNSLNAHPQETADPAMFANQGSQLTQYPDPQPTHAMGQLPAQLPVGGAMPDQFADQMHGQVQGQLQGQLQNQMQNDPMAHAGALRGHAPSNPIPNQMGQGPVAPPLPGSRIGQPTDFRGGVTPASPSNFPGRLAAGPASTGNHLRSAGYAQPASSRAAGQSGQGRPGDRRLEGAQSPSVVIHKRAPSEVKVGKPASFVIHVQNVGSADAMNVQVFDKVPEGMVLQDATPRPQASTTGEYVWQLGNLSAGEERTVTMELVPQAEGELGSVARVTFEAAASVRTISTRPELKVSQRAPASVLVGQQLEIEVEVSNPGTGDATGVLLQEDVPEGLEHPVGRQLDNLIGTLRPGEVRRQLLRLRAVAPGVVKNVIRLRGDDGLTANHSVDVKVIAPDLQVGLTGPSRRYLERPAKFNLDVQNAGTAQATNVRIAAFLDRGFTFVEAGNQGIYDRGRHAVIWELASLPPGERGSIPLTLLPVQEGARAIQLEAKADLGAIAKNEHQVTVDSLAELAFSINDSADPIEVGTETTYEIKVTNSGSRADSNVQVQLQIPPGLEVLSADADAQQLGNGVIAFTPRNQLEPNAEMVYRIKTRGRQQGTHLIKAVVTSQQSNVPVTKEESTMVYDDRGVIATQPAGFRR